MNELNFNSRIVGGYQAWRPIPWQVRVGGRCGGTILDEYTILTAAHCNIMSNEYILAGALSLQSSLGLDPKPQYIQVKNNITHYNYKGYEYGYDMSILKLREPLIFNNHVKPACLPKSENFGVGDFAFALASGWGKNGKILIIPFQKLS